MDELNPNEAAAESQEERDAENAILPDLTDVVDLKQIEVTVEPTEEGDAKFTITKNVPHSNEYTGGITETKSDYPGNRGY